MVENKKQYESYKKVKHLNEGSYGTAYLVKAKSDSSLCVIKSISLAALSDAERKETLREAKILEYLNHPNIVRFREVFKTKQQHLNIVMEYCDDKDLGALIKT
jgi:NIMA (never in mitosis gene a)-related kinase